MKEAWHSVENLLRSVNASAEHTDTDVELSSP